MVVRVNNNSNNNNNIIKKPRPCPHPPPIPEGTGAGLATCSKLLWERDCAAQLTDTSRYYHPPTLALQLAP